MQKILETIEYFYYNYVKLSDLQLWFSKQRKPQNMFISNILRPPVQFVQLSGSLSLCAGGCHVDGILHLQLLLLSQKSLEIFSKMFPHWKEVHACFKYRRRVSVWGAGGVLLQPHPQLEVQSADLLDTEPAGAVQTAGQLHLPRHGDRPALPAGASCAPHHHHPPPALRGGGVHDQTGGGYTKHFFCC